jgi:hypothetical protein
MGASTVVLEVITIEGSEEKLGRVRKAGSVKDVETLDMFFTTGLHTKPANEVMEELETYCGKRGILFRQLATSIMPQKKVKAILKRQLKYIS